MASRHSDNPKALTKKKELVVYQALKDAGVAFDYQYRMPFHGCGLDSETKYAVLDFVITMPWGHWILEVDENQHKAYDVSCDPRRDFDIMSSAALAGHQKIVILHYNPDSWMIGNIRCTMQPKLRHKRLVEVLRGEPPSSARLFLYYDRKLRDDTLPAVAEHWSGPVRELSRVVAE